MVKSSWCTWRTPSPLLHVARPRLGVQLSCKPHWRSSVIHTHYYFTSSGTTALTAPVSPALIREKAASQLTEVYLYNLPSHAASRCKHAHCAWLQLDISSVSVSWERMIKAPVETGIRARTVDSKNPSSDSKCQWRKQQAKREQLFNATVSVRRRGNVRLIQFGVLGSENCCSKLKTSSAFRCFRVGKSVCTTACTVTVKLKVHRLLLWGGLNQKGFISAVRRCVHVCNWGAGGTTFETVKRDKHGNGLQSSESCRWRPSSAQGLFSAQSLSWLSHNLSESFIHLQVWGWSTMQIYAHTCSNTPSHQNQST